MLVPFPIVFLNVTLACDVAFWWTANPGWATAAAWALGAGLATGALAAMAGLADVLGSAEIRALKDAWHHFIGNAAVLILAFVNLYLRWSSASVADTVLPAGILLSAVVAGLLLYTAWKGGELVYRHGVGMASVLRRVGRGAGPVETVPPSHIHARHGA